MKNMPQAFIDALEFKEKQDHLAGIDYSVTTLLKSPRAVQLEKRHKNNLPEAELNSRLARFLGHAIHGEVEEGLKHNDNYIIEHRMIFHDKPAGADDSKIRVIAGTADCIDKRRNTLIDHKTTTTYIYGMELKPEWIAQLNLYAYLLRREGIPIDKLAINAIYKDWRQAAAKYKKNDEYPELPVQEFVIDPWSNKDQEEFYNTLLTEHIAAEDLSDDELPLCSPDYCWERQGSYAVYKPGASKATRLCPSADVAKDYIKSKKLIDYKIEHRCGERTRCDKYCSAAPFCSQYKQWCEQQNQETANAILDNIPEA